MINIEPVIKMFDKTGKEITIPCECGNKETLVIFTGTAYKWHCPICRENNKGK